MKRVLLIALAVYSAVATNISNSPGKSGGIFQDCVEQVGFSADELNEFKGKSVDWPLTDKEESLVCCVVDEASLVRNKAVNVPCVQHMLSQRQAAGGLKISKAVDECSSTGIESNNLVTDYHVATFFRCLLDKLQIQLSSIETTSVCRIN